MGEMTGGIKGGMKKLKSFVYKAFRCMTGGIETILIKTIQKVNLKNLNQYLQKPELIPRLGTNYSQVGNETFPIRE